MRFTASLLAAVITAIQVTGQAVLIPWSGFDCDVAEGERVPCVGTCFNFTGHSFQMAFAPATPIFFPGADCTGAPFDVGIEPAGQCVDLVSDTVYQSVTCVT
ncbi:hypothetical protein B0H16DRAFT_1830296 [Mycena metata]|uniref:Uncharacterized protein n=1 Tax=Mycena metata TaxID=1033252 RepID=A0AAD7K992_9AGAR|nr:hypothetical protein B0H16DRAFT_1830296 [Mycena metata]